MDFKNKLEFIDYLENTLIPSLKESGNTATAEDFETALHYLSRGDIRTLIREKNINEEALEILWENGLDHAVKEHASELMEMSEQFSVIIKGGLDLASCDMVVISALLTNLIALSAAKINKFKKNGSEASKN